MCGAAVPHQDRNLRTRRALRKFYSTCLTSAFSEIILNAPGGVLAPIYVSVSRYILKAPFQKSRIDFF